MDEKTKKVILLALNYMLANLGDVQDLHEETPIVGWEGHKLPTMAELDELIVAFKAPVETPKVMTMQECAQEALDVQNACNLSGVVHSFSRVLHGISQYAFANKKPTEWVNTHPIVFMFLDKLNQLNGYKTDGLEFMHKSDAVEAIAKGERVE